MPAIVEGGKKVNWKRVLMEFIGCCNVLLSLWIRTFLLCTGTGDCFGCDLFVGVGP